MLNAFEDSKLNTSPYSAYCVRSDDSSRVIPNPAKQGMKGAGLFTLLNLKIATPKFIIFTTDLLSEVDAENIDYDKMLEQIQQSFPNFPGQMTLSVRPAGVDTMPGMYTTKLGIDNWNDLKAAIQEGYASWNNPEAKAYRRTNNIGEDTGMALVIQEMVYGDNGEMSGSGAFYTRNMETGENKITGTYYRNKRGDTTMSGTTQAGQTDENYFMITPSNMEMHFGPESYNTNIYGQLVAIKKQLEAYYHYPQEIEFTIDKGQLYILQTRNADVPDFIRNKILTDMYKEGLIDIKMVTNSYNDNFGQRPIYRLDFQDQNSTAEDKFSVDSLSPGAVAGRLAFSLERAREYKQAGDKVILVVKERSSEYLQALNDAEFDGLITFYGNRNMHDARIAREVGIPGISILGGKAFLDGENLMVSDRAGKKHAVKEGEMCTIDGWADTNDKGRFYSEDYSQHLALHDVVVQHTGGINVAEIRENVRNQLNNLPVKDLQILHSILRALISRAEMQNNRDIQMIALDISLNALHDLLKEKETNLTVEQLNLRLYNLYQGFNDFQTGFSLPRTAQEFLDQAEEILDQIYQRYGQENLPIVALDHCNYGLSLGGQHNRVAFDLELPLEFSMVFAKDVNLADINFNLLMFVQDIDLFFHYAAYDNDRDSSGRLYRPGPEAWSKTEPGLPNSDLHVSKMIFEIDRMNSQNIRVKAVVDLPKTANYIESSFYFNIGGRQVWLRTKEYDELIVIAKSEETAPSFYEILSKDIAIVDRENYARQLPNLLQEVTPKKGMTGSLTYSKTNLLTFIEKAVSQWHLRRTELGIRSATVNTVVNIKNEDIYDWRTRTLFKLIDNLFPGELTVLQSENVEPFEDIGKGGEKIFRESKFEISDDLKIALADTLILFQQNNIDLTDSVFIMSDFEDLRGINLDNLMIYIYKCLVEDALSLAPEARQKIGEALILKSNIELGAEVEPISVTQWKERIIEQSEGNEIKIDSYSIVKGFQQTKVDTYSVTFGYGANGEVNVLQEFVYAQSKFDINKLYYTVAANYLHELFDLETPVCKEVETSSTSQAYGHNSSVDSHYKVTYLELDAETEDKLADLLFEMSKYVPQEVFYEQDGSISLIKVVQIHKQLKEAGLIQ